MLGKENWKEENLLYITLLRTVGQCNMHTNTHEPKKSNTQFNVICASAVAVEKRGSLAHHQFVSVVLFNNNNGHELWHTRNTYWKCVQRTFPLLYLINIMMIMTMSRSSMVIIMTMGEREKDAVSGVGASLHFKIWIDVEVSNRNDLTRMKACVHWCMAMLL